MDKATMIDGEDLREWAAYKRDVRRQREEHIAVIIVSIATLVGLACVAGSFAVKMHREHHLDVAERAALVELLKGGGK